MSLFDRIAVAGIPLSAIPQTDAFLTADQRAALTEAGYDGTFPYEFALGFIIGGYHTAIRGAAEDLQTPEPLGPISADVARRARTTLERALASTQPVTDRG